MSTDDGKRKPHKWAKEIKAWADGATIEYRYKKGGNPDKDHERSEWMRFVSGPWHDEPAYEYRIKPEPREFWIVRPRNEWTHVLPAPPMAVHDDTEVIHVREVLP